VSLAGLPAGTYYVAVLPQLPTEGQDAWQDPETLQVLAQSATTITIPDGERVVITLKKP
jgi:hypothetical protein